MIQAGEKPLYMQAVDQIKKDIDAGIYKEEEKLPSEFELSKQLGVNRMVVRKAIQMLEDEGHVIQRHGVGTFVQAKPLFKAGIEELHSVTDMILKANMIPGTIFISSTVQSATCAEKDMFARDDLTEVLEVERVRTADNTPVVYCIDKVPNDIVANYSIHEIQSVFHFLEKIGKPIAYAVTYIEPIGYHEHVSEILQCPPESSLLLLKQMHYDHKEKPLLYSLNYFRADQFTFHVIRKRESAHPTLDV